MYLQSTDNLGQLTGYQESRQFGAAEPDLTHGLTTTSDGLVFAVLSEPTRGAANAAPAVGPVVIHEIMYNAATGGVDFVELKNLTDELILLDGGGGNLLGVHAWHSVSVSCRRHDRPARICGRHRTAGRS